MAAAAGAPAAGRPRAGGLRRLNTASLRERARDAIRTSIVSGGLAPDVVYSVASLGSRLGVSATPIREALFDLSGEGLVEVLPKRGIRVPRLSEQDLDEITALRVMLEIPPAARLARAGLDDGAAPRLRELAARTVAAAQAGDIMEFLAADQAFHLALLQSEGNERLLQLVGRLRDQARLYGPSALQASGQLVRSAAEHQKILEAVENRDPGGVTRCLEHHLRHARGLRAGRSGEQP